MVESGRAILLTPGKRALVLGLAKSGEAAATLLHERGVTVVANDQRDRDAVQPTADNLESLGIELQLGGHPLDLLRPRPDFIVKNPGIRYSVPLVATAIQQGIPVYSEIEVASWLTEAPIYAITGSNGKTTTTTLVGEMLTTAGLHPVVAGNIGRALSGVVDQIQNSQAIVLEVSSFQLMGTDTFHPKIAALLNLYAAHLDYHGTFEAYADAKMKLFANMTSDDVAVLNYDSEAVRARSESVQAHVVWFSRTSILEEGVFVRDGRVIVRRDGVETPVISVADIALAGDHNLEDALAATAISAWAGASTESIADVLAHFRSVEHRLEFVRTVEGVDFINDSKATNAQAALTALKSMGSPVVWIAGGLDRGDDFAQMADDVSTRVKHAVLLGESAPKLAALCERIGVQHQVVLTLADAVAQASRVAQAPDVVLLSPACASWDMFTSFEERGGMFKELVHRL